LPITIYNVYEAKKLGEIADGVGKRTSIIVFSPPENPGETVGMHSVNQAGREYLDGKYEEFGLKPVKNIEFGDEFLKSP
jgi:hypothetical protein